MDTLVVYMDGTFFYNRREVMLVEVLDSYNLQDNDTITRFKTGKKIVTYYPKNGIIENIATGEKYVYGNVTFNGTDTLLKPFKGSFNKKDKFDGIAIKSNILTDEDINKFNQYVKDNNIKGSGRQRALYDGLVAEKGLLIFNEWIKENCNEVRTKNK